MTLAVRAVEAGVVALALLLPIRLFAQRGFRRKLQAFPMLAWTFVLGIIAAISVVAASLLVAPGALHAMTGSVLAGAVFVGWRSRHSHGASRGLPPGSLAPLTTEPWTDIDFYARQAKRYGPVFKMSYGLEPMVCIAELPLGIGLLRDYEESLEAPPLPFNERIPHGFIRYMDAEARPGYRASLRQIFSRATVEESSERIRCLVRESLPSIVSPDDGARPTPLHLALYEIVFASMSDLFFGISPSFPEFRKWRRAFADADFRHATLAVPVRVTRALVAIESVVHARAAELGSDDVACPSCFLRNAVAHGHYLSWRQVCQAWRHLARFDKRPS